jgi:hypothetical protein
VEAVCSKVAKIKNIRGMAYTPSFFDATLLHQKELTSFDPVSIASKIA